MMSMRELDCAARRAYAESPPTGTVGTALLPRVWHRRDCSPRSACGRGLRPLHESCTMGGAKRNPSQPMPTPHRHQIDPDHRRRPDRHRPGLRVRLFRHPGLQGAQGRGLPDRAGELQSGDDHDRPGPRRRHLYRADHAGDRRQDHREGAPGRAAADHGRADRAQHRAVAEQDGRAREVRRRDDRRHRARPSTRPRTASCSATR